MLRQFRITKYDPANRDRQGRYLVDEWTEAWDIGKDINGHTLTLDDYLVVEARYVRAAERFFQASGLGHLRVNRVGMHEADDDTDHVLYVPAFADIRLAEDGKITAGDLPLLLRAMLRGYCWCQLDIDGQFFIHTGWDYYMYVGINADCADQIIETEADGLFVEELPSPYHCPDDVTPVPVVSAYPLPLDEFGMAAGMAKSTKFPALTIPQIRDCFGLSDEHPCTQIFEVLPGQAKQLEALIDYRFDFDKYVYNLTTSHEF